MGEPEPDAPPSQRALTLAWALLLGATLWHGLHPVSDLDLWWQMRLGEQILASDSLVPVDPFSHTFLGAPWPYKDAAFAVSAHLLWTLGGAAAVVVFKAAAFVGLTALLWRLLRHARSLPPALATAAVALAIDGTAYRFTERAASLSLLILVAALLLIERDRQGRHGLWWVIALTCLNANLHRGVLVLPVILTVYAGVCAAEAATHRESHASARWKRNASIAVAATLAAMATPFTTALLSSSQTLMSEHTSALSEWAPVSWQLAWALSPSSLVLAAAAVLACAALLRVRPLPLWDLALVVLALTLGLSSMRHLPYLALLGIGPVARAVAHWIGWIRRVGGLLAIAFASALLALALEKPLARPSLGLAPAHFPERGVAFVQGLPDEIRLRGNMFNEFGYGGYLIFHLSPEYRVFVDGRTDLIYSHEHVEAAVDALTDSATFERLVEQHEVEWAILDNAPHARPRAHFDANPAWRLVHASRRALLYVRADGPNRGLAQQRGYRWLWPHDLDGSIARAAAHGNGRAAVEELRRMLAEDPDNVYALGALARLSSRLDVPVE